MINARNEQILEKGRTEMEGIPGGWPAHDSYEQHPALVGDPVESTAPGTARETSPTAEEKSRGIRKLFKRKPVAETGTGKY